MNGPHDDGSKHCMLPPTGPVNGPKVFFELSEGTPEVGCSCSWEWNLQDLGFGRDSKCRGRGACKIE